MNPGDYQLYRDLLSLIADIKDRINEALRAGKPIDTLIAQLDNARAECAAICDDHSAAA